jgi:membrane-associated protease RseP (regulator of RpoE activity)
LFFLIVPIGAFVDVDEDEIKVAKPRRSLRVMAAGVGVNIVVAVVCLMGVLLVVGSLAPVVDGVYVSEVSEGLPAQAAGLMPKDVLVSIDGVLINRTRDLSNLLGNRTAGDVVAVTVARGELWREQYSTFVNLTISENRTVMGVSVGDLAVGDRLRNYQTFSLDRLSMYIVPPTIAGGLVPFSDALSGFYTSSLGGYWTVYANVLYWVWFVNVNLAVFNALPIGPLDGGRMFSITLKELLGRKLSEKRISLIISAVTIALVALVILVVILPFILPYILPLSSG